MNSLIRWVCGAMLIGFAALNAFSFTMHALSNISNDERWFSRLFLLVVCLGFLYLGEGQKNDRT